MQCVKENLIDGPKVCVTYVCAPERDIDIEREREIGTPPGVDMAHEKVVVELVSMDLDVLPEGL